MTVDAKAGRRRPCGTVADDDRRHELRRLSAVDDRDQRLLERAPAGGLVGVDRDALADGRRAHQQLADVWQAGVQRDPGGLVGIGQRHQQEIAALRGADEHARRADRKVQRGEVQRAAGIASKPRGSGAERAAPDPGSRAAD
jgi:hypothetical protein